MFSKLHRRFQRVTTSSAYFPEIDGIRFLAITWVFLLHVSGYFDTKNLIGYDASKDQSLLKLALQHGHRGVHLFFVLSGFILCIPYAQHFLENGLNVSLRKYYLRRLVRLEPPYFIAMTLFLLFHIIANTNDLSTLLASWLSSLLYSHNIVFHERPLMTVVAWSLEVEIQFYLIAPLLFSVLSLERFVRRFILLTAIIGFAVLQRIFVLPFECLYQYIQFFLAGILLCDLYVTKSFSNQLQRTVIVFLAACSFIYIVYVPQQTYLILEMLIPIAIVFFFLSILLHPVMKRFFSYGVIPLIGGMCYSIYLLHFILISIFGRYTIRLSLTDHFLPNFLLQTVLLAIPVIFLSGTYYLLVERPFMKRIIR